MTGRNFLLCQLPAEPEERSPLLRDSIQAQKSIARWTRDPAQRAGLVNTKNPFDLYAAVIPLWIAALLKRPPMFINGDGETSRDFCFIANVVQANLLAAHCTSEVANQVYNIAVGERTTLNELSRLISELLTSNFQLPAAMLSIHKPFRPGDARHSLADISKAQGLLGYEPTHKTQQGLEHAMTWYRRNVRPLALAHGSGRGCPEGRVRAVQPRTISAVRGDHERHEPH